MLRVVAVTVCQDRRYVGVTGEWQTALVRERPVPNLGSDTHTRHGGDRAAGTAGSDGSRWGSIGPYRFKGTVWNPKTLPKTPTVGSHTLHRSPAAHPKGYKAVTRYRVTNPVWPKAGTKTVGLTRTVSAPAAKTAGTPSAASSTPTSAPPRRFL